MAYIYLIENRVNGHKYVGQTSRSLKVRLKLHYAESKRFTKRPLYNAFRKHGIGNFKVKILERCEIEKLNQREEYWIDFFNTYKDPKHYNCTPGGEGGEISEDTKERISEGMKKVDRSEEWVENMSKGLQKKLAKGEKWGFMNGDYDTTTHFKRKIKATPSLPLRVGTAKRPIGEKEIIFSSSSEAAKFLNGRTSNISRAANDTRKGKHTVAYGYKWEFLDNRPLWKKVYGVNRDSGQMTEVFPSIKAAARNWGKRDSGLRNALDEPGIKSFMNHYWYYAASDTDSIDDSSIG